MKGPKVFIAAVLCTASFVWAGIFAPKLFSQSAAGAAKPAIMPLSEVRTGMKGIGKTVFVGNKVEDFDVEILGVLQNVSPKQSVILARLSGKGLEHSGVAAGMSGSPVYINGRLIGAVALGFQFSKDPIAGITPIENMIAAAEEPAAGPSGLKTAWRFEPDANTGTPARVVSTAEPNLLPPTDRFSPSIFWGGTQTSLVPVGTPLVLSGFTAEAIQQFAGPLRSLGFVPVQGGGSGSTGDNRAGDPSRLEPGSMISVQLIRGDMGASADGTVTMLDGGRVYAFGHPFLSTGDTEIPFAESQVVTVLADYATSMKITTPGGLLGVIGQDRSTGVSGYLGRKARTVPVQIDVDSSTGRTHQYRFEVVNDRFLLPFLVNFTAYAAISASERMIGESTLRVQQNISLNGLPDIESESFVSGPANSAMVAAQSAATPMAYLMQSGMGPLEVTGVRLKIVSTDRLMAQEVKQVWSSKRQIRPGEPLEITALLRAKDGKESLQKTSIDVPASVTPGPLTITVGDGTSMDRLETWRAGKPVSPRSTLQLVRAINKSRRNNRLYVRLSRTGPGFVLQGEVFPSPPPSVVKALSAGAGASTEIIPTVQSTIAEFEMDPVESVVSGTKSITVTVKN